MDVKKAVTRRQFLRTAAGAAALLAASAVARPAWAQGTGYSPASPGLLPLRQKLLGAHHLAWVWEFEEDGSPDLLRDTLSAHGLGIAVKTHDGTQWMAKYDKSPHAVSGPAQLERLAAYFEAAGVPFHAWCNLKGLDPVHEARMCGEVLSAGARSLTLDVEPHAGFWQATAREALIFGQELRRLHPGAWISVSLDPRPWYLDQIPLAEFASFSNELAPQIYWDTFSTQANLSKYVLSDARAAQGITPSFLVESTVARLSQYRLLIQPVGQGASRNINSWRQFVNSAFANNVEAVSVWRFGVTQPNVWEVLHLNPPRPHNYVIGPGDTLSSLARRWGATVSDIAELNGISNPNIIHVGQRILVPRGARGPSVAAAQPIASMPRYYRVQPGDTLSELASYWKRSVADVARANGISRPDLIYVGQQLQIP